MTNLRVRPTQPDADGRVIDVTPESAGWRYVGFQLRRLAKGKTAAFSYPDREAAMNRLRQLGEPAALYLMNADSRSWSVEQSTRVDLFLAPYRPLSDEAANELHSDPDFLLDCLYSSDAVIRRMALDQLGNVAGKRIDLDPRLSSPALDDSIAKLRLSLVRSDTRP